MPAKHALHALRLRLRPLPGSSRAKKKAATHAMVRKNPREKASGKPCRAMYSKLGCMLEGRRAPRHAQKYRQQSRFVWFVSCVYLMCNAKISRGLEGRSRKGRRKGQGKKDGTNG